MASLDDDSINIDKLEKDLLAAVEADDKYWRENDAKIRAVTQKVGSYDEFRQIVLAAHLKPLEKKDKIESKFVQPWNQHADLNKQSSSPVKEPTTISQDTDKLPKSGTEFARDWRRYCKTQKDKYNFIIHIGAQRLGQIFKTEISYGLLGDILSALDSELQDSDVEGVIQILEQLATTNRFELSLQFLSAAEKTVCGALFVKLGKGILDESCKDDLQERITCLEQKYQLNQ